MEYANINFKIPLDIKVKLENLCDSLGLNLTNYFNMAARAAIYEKTIPFKLKLNDGINIKEWIRANESSDKTRKIIVEKLNGGLTDKQVEDVFKWMKDEWLREKRIKERSK